MTSVTKESYAGKVFESINFSNDFYITITVFDSYNARKQSKKRQSRAILTLNLTNGTSLICVSNIFQLVDSIQLGPVEQFGHVWPLLQIGKPADHFNEDSQKMEDGPYQNKSNDRLVMKTFSDNLHIGHNLL